MKLIFRHTKLKGTGIVGIGSWLIRRIDKAVLPSGFVADHVGLYDEETGYIYEAHRKDGVRKVMFKDWENDIGWNWEHEIVDLKTIITKHQILSRVQDLKGTQYSYWNLIMQWIYIKKGVWLNFLDDKHNAFVCSEFVDYVLCGQSWWKSSIKDVIRKYVK